MIVFFDVDTQGVKMNYKKIAGTIEKFIYEKVEGQGRKMGVIGLSGGIDSTVVAFLAKNALGPERVFGVCLPYSTQDYHKGRKIAHILDLPSSVTSEVHDGVTGERAVVTIPGIINIQPEVDESISKHPYLFRTPTQKGNLMARERMIKLMDIAYSLNSIVLGTTNKSEFEIGFFTKYGDGGVDVEPVLDLYKMELYGLAEHLGVPPEYLYDKMKPDAGLSDKMNDEQIIGLTYPVLDKILKGNTENIDSSLISRVNKLVRNAEHKKYMPPHPELGKLFKKENHERNYTETNSEKLRKKFIEGFAGLD